ncbi:DNA cytosine methyltransferase [Rhizobium hidalgonense]|uniref:DNA cytosine methyltransferase n=1 Tax=Rhizobium hidalgonense TaxID=1538159 RepID=A0AAJ2LM48_9HYPH|nr:DNA cytosine methyltransferase [Rhizobium hidalgonense]MDR9777225.1 DNA cytosine methyltransferase [Rhizobium hidalgonense]
MTAYYNEIDPYAAQWLRNLISAGHIAPGDVDERSIVDVQPDDISGYTQCHFFAGIGGWSYGLRLAGWPDDRRVWTGSCPCQPLSSAGKQKGHLDERHLWPAFQHLIAKCRPPVVFGEQVAGSLGLRWMSAVRSDLEGDRYACGVACLPGFFAGAPQQRERIYWVASSDSPGCDRVKKQDEQPTAWSKVPRRNDTDGRSSSFWSAAVQMEGADGTRRLLSPGIKLLADGLSEGMGRMRGYGNAIIPQVAAEVIGAYMEIAA